jgi:hypothetical protein
MKRLLFVFFALLVPMFGASNKLGSVCEVNSYGKTGKQLPGALRAAIGLIPKQLPLGEGQYVTLERPVTGDDVVFIQNWDAFVQCVGLSNPEQIEFLRTKVRMFALKADFPIYVPAQRKDIAGAIKVYEQGNDYVPFQLAAWLSHEVVHAFLHEEGETMPLGVELEVQLQFIKEGKLPASTPYVAETRQHLMEAQQSANVGKPISGLRLASAK